MDLVQVVGVITLIDTHLAVVDLVDMVDKGAEKVAVVADQHHGTAEILQGV